MTVVCCAPRWSDCTRRANNPNALSMHCLLLMAGSGSAMHFAFCSRRKGPLLAGCMNARSGSAPVKLIELRTYRARRPVWQAHITRICKEKPGTNDRAKRNRAEAVSQGGDWLMRASPSPFCATCPLLANIRVTSPALREFVLRSVTHGSRACPPIWSCIAECAAPASWPNAGGHLQARYWPATQCRGRSAG